MNCRILTLVLLTLCSLTICLQQVDNHPKGSSDLKVIRQRWNVKNIIRDTDHIKDDMKKIASMQQTGVISNDEALFYFIRMHDFDNNDKLDGLEILTAFNHVTESNEDVSLDNKEKYIDQILTFDHNLDGLISYEELKEYTRASDANEERSDEFKKPENLMHH